LVSFKERREHDLVLSFTNGIGKCSTLEYAYYNSPNIGYFGREGRCVHFPLVSKLRIPNGLGGVTETTYTYGHAAFDFERRQMMGFGLIDTYCNGTNTKMEYEFNKEETIWREDMSEIQRIGKAIGTTITTIMF